MARSRARLHVVGQPAHQDSPDTPEAVLRDLFACEAELAALAIANRRLIDKAVDSYAAHHDLLVRPRVELLRTRFAAPLPALVGGDGPRIESPRP